MSLGTINIHSSCPNRTETGILIVINQTWSYPYTAAARQQLASAAEYSPTDGALHHTHAGTVTPRTRQSRTYCTTSTAYSRTPYARGDVPRSKKERQCGTHSCNSGRTLACPSPCCMTHIVECLMSPRRCSRCP